MLSSEFFTPSDPSCSSKNPTLSDTTKAREKVAASDQEGSTKFSIRDYVFSLRSKDVENSWPFNRRSLQLCLKQNIKSVLPPFESPESIRSGQACHEINSSASLLNDSDGSPSGDELLAGCLNHPADSSQRTAKAAHFFDEPDHTTEFSPLDSQRDDENMILIPKSGVVAATSIPSEPMASKTCPVCKAFASTSNTTLNAHIDQCLSLESTAVAMDEMVTKPQNKPRKKRLMVDIYKTAHPCTLEDLDRRNGTNWASEIALNPSNKMICVENRVPDVLPVNTKNDEHEGDVYFDSNGIKIRILSKCSDTAPSSSWNDEGRWKKSPIASKNKSFEVKFSKKKFKVRWKNDVAKPKNFFGAKFQSRSEPEGGGVNHPHLREEQMADESDDSQMVACHGDERRKSFNAPKKQGGGKGSMYKTWKNRTPIVSKSGTSCAKSDTLHSVDDNGDDRLPASSLQTTKGRSLPQPLRPCALFEGKRLKVVNRGSLRRQGCFDDGALPSTSDSATRKRRSAVRTSKAEVFSDDRRRFLDDPHVGFGNVSKKQRTQNCHSARAVLIPRCKKLDGDTGHTDLPESDIKEGDGDRDQLNRAEPRTRLQITATAFRDDRKRDGDASLVTNGTRRPSDTRQMDHIRFAHDVDVDDGNVLEGQGGDMASGVEAQDDSSITSNKDESDDEHVTALPIPTMTETQIKESLCLTVRVPDEGNTGGVSRQRPFCGSCAENCSHTDRMSSPQPPAFKGGKHVPRLHIGPRTSSPFTSYQSSRSGGAWAASSLESPAQSSSARPLGCAATASAGVPFSSDEYTSLSPCPSNPVLRLMGQNLMVMTGDDVGTRLPVAGADYMAPLVFQPPNAAFKPDNTAPYQRFQAPPLMVNQCLSSHADGILGSSLKPYVNFVPLVRPAYFMNEVIMIDDAAATRMRSDAHQVGLLVPNGAAGPIPAMMSHHSSPRPIFCMPSSIDMSAMRPAAARHSPLYQNIGSVSQGSPSGAISRQFVASPFFNQPPLPPAAAAAKGYMSQTAHYSQSFR